MPAKLDPFPNGVPVTDECVIWPAMKDGEGYGRWFVSNVAKRAHRVMYCLHNGVELDSIAGLVVRHKCDNHPCVNPRHLLIGTQKDNIRDMYDRGRQQDNKGSKHSQAKLDDEKVMAIRKAYQSGSTQRSLSDAYGVSQRAIWSVVTGRTWSHLPISGVRDD